MLAERDFERFWSKATMGPNGCWLWVAAQNSAGYGAFSIGGRAGRMHPAHRVAYESIVGVIPEGMVIDHLCRNRLCVNPVHMEVVTHRENLRRGEGWSGRHARKTHCPAGHPLEGANLSPYHLKHGQRKCLACHAARQRAYKAKKRALGSSSAETLAISGADSGAGA